MAHRDELNSLYVQLSSEYEKGFSDVKKCSGILEKLKIGLTHIAYLPSVGAPLVKDDLLLGRNVLEKGALFSISAKDIPAFERYVAQLKSYYLDFSNFLPESTLKYELLGLNLLWLLTQNRVAEFHTELELLSPNDIQKNVFIHYPVSLEQYLMEGCYNKIFHAKNQVPAPSFNYFLDILVDTIRDEIAVCMEKSFDKIHLSEAAKMLSITNINSMKEYGNKREWSLNSGDYYLFQIDVKKCDDSLTALELAKQAIEYARELEMIV
ncbi:26S proteasome non-ATPase regulatory subunit 8 [Daphnia magna]|uniref:26S proteasome non-ATPase regulatory subunit 8 n=1 Tax=Daphnia magna TaxID=35525 RepID=A0A0P5W793_9CRUS|nr:26S proteasome non-ATPase regulatory subunit 8 [Daphnia magna]